MKKVSMILFVLIIFAMTATGCSTGLKDEKAYNAPKKQTSVKSAAETNGSSQQSARPTTTNPSSSVTNEAGPSSANRKLIGEIMAEAKQGKVLGCDYVAGKTLFEEQVVQLWGKPDSVDYVAPKGRYAVYSSRRITVGVNKGEQLFEVRSYDNQYKELTRADLTNVLGKPDSIRYYKDTAVQQDILVYNATADFQLLFILPQADKNNPEPHVDHISVVNPQAAVNMMAN